MFCFVPFQTTKEKINKTRDDRQGSTHVLSFRRTCCYGNAGCAGSPGGATPSMRGHGRPAATPSRRLAAEDACVLSGRGAGPPNSPHGDRLSQEHFLLPHEGRVGAPKAVFAAVLPAHQTENQRQGRAVPVQPGTSICRFPAACKVIYLTSSFRFSPPLFLAYIQYSKESLYAL